MYVDYSFSYLKVNVKIVRIHNVNEKDFVNDEKVSYLKVHDLEVSIDVDKDIKHVVVVVFFH